MQKTNQGSILIWSLFLSFFVAFAFVSFSLSVHRTIQNAYGINNVLNQVLSLNTFISDPNFTSTGVNSYEQLVKNNTNSFWLQSGKALEVRFSTTSTPSLTISLQKWGPLVYKFVSFKKSTMLSTLSANALVTSSASFNGVIVPGDDNGILYIKNIWGQAEFNYTSTLMWTNPSTGYSDLVKISEQYFEKSKTQKLNFIPWDYPGFNYSKYEMSF